jgi:hypothetical protein
MVSGILLTLILLLLAGYWFRYSCLRVLGGKAHCAAVRGRLSSEVHLESVRQSLDRDYRVFAYLLDHSRAAQASLESRLLVWDYRAMSWWYRATRAKAPGQARFAVMEMASVVAILAMHMGQHTGASHRLNVDSRYVRFDLR